MHRHVYSEERGSRYVRYPAGTEGKLIPVFQDKSDNLTEPKRHDRQVVTTQPQYGKPEKYPECSSQGCTDGQYHPEVETEMVVQKRVGIGTDGIECHIAQVEQTGEPDDDIQPQTKHDVDKGGNHDICLVQ